MKRIFLGLTTFILVLTGAFGLAGVAGAQSKKDLKKAKDLASQGDRSFNRRDYQGAIKKYQESIRVVGNNPYAYFWKGNAHYYLQEYDQALTELNTAFGQGYTPLADLYRIRWFVNYKTKNYDDALADLQKGLALEPDNLLMKAGLGDVYFARQSYREAVDAFNAVVDKIPNNGNVYYNMAFSYFNLGQTDDQLAAAQKAISNGTQYLAEAQLLIGDAAAKRRDFRLAAEAYEKSLNAKQDIYEVYRRLSEVYRNESRFADAVAVTKRGLQQFPRDGGLYTDLSWYYSLSDNPQEAISAGLRAVAFVPDQYMAHTNLCRGYNDNKEYDKAIASCNNALRINPTDGETNFYLGRAYDFKAQPDTATPYYKKAMAGLIEYVKQFPDYSDGFYLLGNAYYANGLRKNAIDAYLKSLELSPRFTKARYNLGYMYVLNGDAASAQAQYNVLVDLDKDLAEKLKTAISRMGKP